MNVGVSRETRDALDIYVAELKRWQARINLVAPSTLPDLWERHIADSLQLLDLVPSPEAAWVDLGSGAGLPGLIVAAARPRASVTLVESDSRKCAFLRSTAAAMGRRVTVVEDRIETALPRIPRADIVTARGLAPLTRLLAYAQPMLAEGAIGLFPKGRRHADELTKARESWIFAADLLPSRTDPAGRILRITDLRSRPVGEAVAHDLRPVGRA